MSEPKTEAVTEYVVLRAASDISDWRELEGGPWRAQSAQAAIRTVLATLASPAGTYLAIPARSYKPVTVKTETQTVLKLESAS